MIAKEAREVRGLRKSETHADVAELGIVVQHGLHRAFHPHDIEIDLRRHADRRLEQPEKVRPRQTGLPREIIDVAPPRGDALVWVRPPAEFASPASRRSFRGSLSETPATA